MLSKSITSYEMLDEIDKIISADPTWNKICWRQSPTNSSCADETVIGGRISKATPKALFNIAYGDDLSEIT